MANERSGDSRHEAQRTTRATRATRPLRPEVLTPGREQTGIAVVLVAASALAFALAGSAFALWARATAHQCDHDHFTAAIALDADEAPATGDTPCNSELIEHSGQSYYRVCPIASVDVQPALEVAIEEHEGMVVYRIVK